MPCDWSSAPHVIKQLLLHGLFLMKHQAAQLPLIPSVSLLKLLTNKKSCRSQLIKEEFFVFLLLLVLGLENM